MGIDFVEIGPEIDHVGNDVVKIVVVEASLLLELML